MEAFSAHLPERPHPRERGAGISWHPDAIIHPRRMKTFGKYPSRYPMGAVVHYTAGRTNSSLDWGLAQGYCYLLINGDGSIHQAHPIEEWGYHAGKSSYPGLNGTVSDELIGIEIACAGRVKEVIVNGQKRYKADFHKHESEYFQPHQVRYAEGRDNIKEGFYQKYTDAQEATLIELLLWLKHNDPVGCFSFDYVLGHDSVAPDRKQDPGGSLSMTIPELQKLLKEEYAKS